jgi:hypothetical protein
VAGVRLRFSSSDSGIEDVALPLERSDDMWTARGSVVSIPGAWRVVVLVDRGVDSAEIPLVFHTRCRAQAPAGGSDPRIYDIDLTGMGSAQAYADPGRPGTNEVHFTFFDEKGKELKVADDPRIGAFQKSPERLDARRFSAGHFVARASLRAGTWIFSFDGKTSSGDALTVCFSDEIR